MKRYKKGVQIKHRNEIVVIKDGRQYINPQEDVLLADGWEEYIEPQIPALERAKNRVKRSIARYDLSDSVNAFFIGEVQMWLDKATRAGLMLRFQAEQATGKESTSLWSDGMMYTLPLENAVAMLYALEVYASQCYDNTQRHLAEVEKLQTIEEVEAYDYTEGYPSKLRF